MFAEIAAQIHTPYSLFAPPAPASDRAAWESLDVSLRRRLTTDGEQYLDCQWPSLTPVDYLEFSRTGNRVHYEDKMFARRTMLDTLVLAECAEYQGRFLDDILNGIYAICGEAAWQLPAHNSYMRDTPPLPLPDITRPVVDLFAAETGAVLAMADYLLKDALMAVSPAISRMIADHLDRRILTPYLTEHFWWMGDGQSTMNNWTIWCTQNVLLTAFTHELDESRQEAVFQKACQSIDYFLAEYGEDGCCDEGAQYYRHAGLCLFNCIEILDGITGDRFRHLYQNSKIKNIAAYIQNVHVDGIYYINFSDCSPVAGRCGVREYLFGKRTGNQALMQLAASDFRQSDDPMMTEEHNLFYRLQTVFNCREMAGFHCTGSLSCPDLYYQSVGLFIARSGHLCLAVKAGDNDDSHNHNDTGSFTVYKDGQPLFIDVGVESYTKKTFSPDRYSIWTMQSQYHNLPSFGTVGGSMQRNGPQYRAREVSCRFDPDESGISMDIADAYPDPEVHSYRRTALLKKTDQIITIQDAYDGSRQPALLSLMTYEAPSWDPGLFILHVGELGVCRITGAKDVRTERIPITDPRLQGAWKHDIYRTVVTFGGSDLELSIQ